MHCFGVLLRIVQAVTWQSIVWHGMAWQAVMTATTRMLCEWSCACACVCVGMQDHPDTLAHAVAILAQSPRPGAHTPAQAVAVMWTRLHLFSDNQLADMLPALGRFAAAETQAASHGGAGADGAVSEGMGSREHREDLPLESLVPAERAASIRRQLLVDAGERGDSKGSADSEGWRESGFDQGYDACDPTLDLMTRVGVRLSQAMLRGAGSGGNEAQQALLARLGLL